MVDPRTTSTRDFHAQMQALAAAQADAVEGFFGLDSLTWRVSREAVLFATGARTLLLQVAHPKVAQGVADHSKFREDGLGRAFRTFDAVFKLVFGGADTAVKTATRVHAIHGRITGSVRDALPPGVDPRYEANDPALLLWVYATLIDSALYGYETFVGPLAAAERDAWYQESKTFAALFGLDDATVPATLADFEAYFRAMLHGPTLHVTPTAREVADALLRGGPWLLRPFNPFNRVLAAGMLTPRLRDAFGLPWNAARSVSYETALAAIRTAARTMPPALRAHPAAAAAEWRARRARRGERPRTFAPAPAGR